MISELALRVIMCGIYHKYALRFICLCFGFSSYKHSYFISFVKRKKKEKRVIEFLKQWKSDISEWSTVVLWSDGAIKSYNTHSSRGATLGSVSPSRTGSVSLAHHIPPNRFPASAFQSEKSASTSLGRISFRRSGGRTRWEERLPRCEQEVQTSHLELPDSGMLKATYKWAYPGLNLYLRLFHLLGIASEGITFLQASRNCFPFPAPDRSECQRTWWDLLQAWLL